MSELEAERRKAIAKYEAFISDRLQPDLQDTEQRRHAIYESLATWAELKNNLELINRQKSGTLRTMVNLGADCHVGAVVPSTELVCIDIGLSFFVEMTIPEALQFIAVRMARIQEEGAKLTERVANIKSNIRVMEDSVASLVRLS